MAGESISLEELIDQATDICNTTCNDEIASKVTAQINREIGGPQSAAKLLVAKLHLHQEVVTLQTLNVIERCVKDCGVKFHMEVGKYKFINELIKLLSPKYDADITPPSVKDRIIELLFSWYVGLPNEKKIAEAYKMLKQQGIIKRDPIDPARSGEPLPRYNEDTVFNNEANADLLKTLLSSSNPDDLHSANRLIKTMVKEEEDRLERVSKRIEDLELVSNNVHLLEDMLVQNDTTSNNAQLEMMHDLYESCLRMRPDLFRLASRSAQDQDDSMAEILSASDELTRVIDLYKEKILLEKVTTGHTKPYNIKDEPNAPTSLLDLDFDSPPTTTAVEDTNSNSLLDAQFKLLGLDVSKPTTPPPSTHQQFTQFYQSPAPMQPMHPFAAPHHQPPTTYPAPRPGVSVIGAVRPPPPTAPPKKKDLLDFDVFSEFRIPDLSKPKDSTDGANQSAIDFLIDINDTTPAKEEQSSILPQALPTPVPCLTSSSFSPLTPGISAPQPPNPPTNAQLATSIAPSHDPSSQENYIVPLEALTPTSHPPTSVLDKDDLKTFLNIATDKRDAANKNVIVTVLSTISTNPQPIKNFTIQVAVPKSMRVKLQAASSSELASFNPILPPPTLTQVMLIANPTKENVRLRFKVLYTVADREHVETCCIENFPVR